LKKGDVQPYGHFRKRTQFVAVISPGSVRVVMRASTSDIGAASRSSHIRQSQRRPNRKQRLPKHRGSSSIDFTVCPDIHYHSREREDRGNALNARQSRRPHVQMSGLHAEAFARHVTSCCAEPTLPTSVGASAPTREEAGAVRRDLSDRRGFSHGARPWHAPRVRASRWTPNTEHTHQ
jgi:hypothetical protein